MFVVFIGSLVWRGISSGLLPLRATRTMEIADFDTK